MTTWKWNGEVRAVCGAVCQEDKLMRKKSCEKREDVKQVTLSFDKCFPL